MRTVTSRRAHRGLRLSAFRIGIPVIALVACGCGGSDTSPEQRNEPPAVPAAEPPPAVRAPRESDWFEDVTRGTGIDVSYESGRLAGRLTIVESVGGGAALLDHDGDGDLDVYLPGGGGFEGTPLAVRVGRSKLYRNDGDFTFVDVTDEAGLGEPIDYSHGAFAADYDRDGRVDLFVTCLGRSRLFRNEGGRFRDVTEESGLVVDGWSTAAAWGDVDGDGWLDLYVAQYLAWTPSDDTPCGPRDELDDVCAPQKFEPADDRLFRNRGDGTFEDVSAEAGLEPGGMGLGVVATDFDRDGDVDFYVANDVVANFLYLGGEGLALEEVGALTGAGANEFGAPEGSMGVDCGDVDGDGRCDLWVTNYELEDNSLYLERDGLYVHSTAAAGLGGSSRTNVGFGTALADLDLDGRLDMFVLNGHVLYRSRVAPFAQRPFLYRGLDGGRFESVAESAPFFEQPGVWRGAAVGDLDDDGALDLLVVGQDEPTRILRNRRNDNSWVRVRLVGTKSPTDPIGARVLVEYDGRTIVRWCKSGHGYLSTSDPRILLPVEGEAVEVLVEWPSGRHETFRALAPSRTHELVEDRGDEP